MLSCQNRLCGTRSLHGCKTSKETSAIMELKTLHTPSTELAIGYAESRIGGRYENQDNFGSKDTNRGFLVTVCDGMGGGPGGKTASTIAVNEIIATIDNAPSNVDDFTAIGQAIANANLTMIRYGQKYPELRGMGSTATILLLTEKSAIVAHVGDSRVYQLRGDKKIFRTFDHSHVFELVRNGIINEEQARLSAESNIITRALGIYENVKADIVELPYCRGDVFMLCSDGIHGTMKESELLKLVGKRKNVLGTHVDDIATIIDNLGHTSGGHHDNLTIALVETTVNSKLKPKMTKLAKLIIVILAVICVASIGVNVYQFTDKGGTASVSDSVMSDSIMMLKKDNTVLKDSIILLKDSITRE